MSGNATATRVHLSDDELVARAKSELPYNARAFEIIVRRYEPKVLEACVRYLGSDQDAEEVSQDVFLRVFHGLKRFEGRATFRTWLYRIVRNECATRYRKRKRTAERQDVVRHHLLTESPRSTPAPRIDEGWTGPVGVVLKRLSEQDREILILRHIGALEFQEIAEALEIGLSATKMRLYRAEERFQAAYETVRSKDE